MTKQEALDLLKDRAFMMCAVDLCDMDCQDCHEALDMAIKALEQETVSKETYDHEFNLRKMFEMKVFGLERKIADMRGENLINKQDALDAIAKFIPCMIDNMSTVSYANGLKDAYNLIYQLPPLGR